MPLSDLTYHLTMEYNLIVDFLPDMSSFSGCFLEPYRLFSYYYCISYPFSVLVFVHCVPMIMYIVSWIMRLVLFQPPADFPETDLQLVAYYSILCILCFNCSDCWLFYTLVKINFQENWSTQKMMACPVKNPLSGWMP